MARDDEQTNVRIPSDLKEWLLSQALKTRRSLTAEVVVALEEYRAKHLAKEAKRAAS